jgi:hypothetical protein
VARHPVLRGGLVHSDVYGFAHQLMLVVSIFQWIRCVLAVAKWMGKLQEETRVQYVQYAELAMMVAPAFLASKPETYHLVLRAAAADRVLGRGPPGRARPSATSPCPCLRC